MENLNWIKSLVLIAAILSGMLKAQIVDDRLPLTKMSGFGMSAINDIAFDTDGNTWIATNNHIYRLPPGSDTPEKYFDTGAYCLGYDERGEVFVGLKNNQLLYTSNFKTYPLNIENSDVINCIISDEDNFITGTNKFILKVPQINVKEYTLPKPVVRLSFQEMNLENINKIIIDSLDRHWIASDSGLFMLNGENLTLIRDLPVTAMIAKPGGLWLATADGIYTLERYRKWKKWELCPEATNFKIEDMEMDARGNLWMVSNVLAVLKNNGECIIYSDKEGFSSNHGLALAVDHLNNVWVGTEGKGVYILKDTLQKKISEDEARRYAFMSGYKPNRLILLLDCSNSMNAEGKLPALKKTMERYINLMRPEDEVAIISFGNNAEVILPFTSCTHSKGIISNLEKMSASGKTKLDAGLKKAYDMLMKDLSANHNNRILLATDGRIEVTRSIKRELRLLSKKPISLNTLDFGKRSNDDLRRLTTDGGGDYFLMKHLKIDLDELIENQLKPAR